MGFDLKEHLKILSEAHAPSGHEAPMRMILRDLWGAWVDDFEQDKLGSLIAVKRATDNTSDGKTRRIMIAAHMDEIGLMVRDIVDGFIYVHRISGVDNRVMLAQPVMIHGREPVRGIVAAIAPHLSNDRASYPGFDELVIDTGLPADEVNRLVRIGDLITPDAKVVELMGNKVAGKAMDDRASLAAISVCLDELSRLRHSWDVYMAATVQEETGLYGAATAAYQIEPDIAVAIDVGFGKQPGVDSDASFEVGQGPSLGMGPNFHRKLNEKLRETAKYHDIKLHDELLSGRSGTDAWAIQIAHEGVPTALFSLPIRNMHSPVETVSLKDIERVGRLLALFITSLDDEFLPSIDWDELIELRAKQADS